MKVNHQETKTNEDSNRIAICLVVDKNDNILMGLREDCEKWANPAGHIKIGEDPYVGAQRELIEETNLDAKEIKLVEVSYNKDKKILLYLFVVQVDLEQEIDVSNDPDKEFITARFLDPNEIKEEMHIPVDENVAIKYWINN